MVGGKIIVMKIFFKILVYAFACFWAFYAFSEIMLIVLSKGADGSIVRLLIGLALTIAPIYYAIKKLR